ncbi:hypothetical protein [Accumulibacter sp.]|uniref:hypothetical protein n=1 Tax=Accumulibacter sp. TaxID=2053492 RepID=UPI0025CF1348|nr:hypothetical protein [Accumulibacter sp.]MCP5228650.1 hypothetical protein [Accumulibacter sp.]
MLAFVANGARAVPGFDVAPDPRTGTTAENTRSALHITISETQPAKTIASGDCGGRSYSVGDTHWDRSTFAILGDLFQTAAGEVRGVDLPITISK